MFHNLAIPDPETFAWEGTMMERGCHWKDAERPDDLSTISQIALQLGQRRIEIGQRGMGKSLRALQEMTKAYDERFPRPAPRPADSFERFDKDAKIRVVDRSISKKKVIGMLPPVPLKEETDHINEVIRKNQEVVDEKQRKESERRKKQKSKGHVRRASALEFGK